MTELDFNLDNLDFNLDNEAIETFMLSMNSAELAHFNRASADDEDGSVVLPILGIMAARRLGHPEITKEDMATVPMRDVLALVEKAAFVPPEYNQRVEALLAELGKSTPPN